MELKQNYSAAKIQKSLIFARLMNSVTIIGAGPAGSLCGYLLKKAGVNCVIVDYATFPREKICGGGLTPKAYGLLQELIPDFHYAYQGVGHFRLMMDGRTLCEVDLDKELRMVRRKDFDNELLHQYLALGGILLKDTFSHYEIHNDGTILVKLKSGKQLTCDYLVGADGANSRVRKQLTGQRFSNSLWMERYVKKGPNEFVFEFSRRYPKGYYFCFPNIDWDVEGMGGLYSSPQAMRSHLGDDGLKAAFISLDTVESGKNHVMLIGDAGGFANKLTYEGLYYAIATGRNACQAIVEGKDFAVTNREIYRKKRKEVWMTRLFYSQLGLGLMKLGAYCPKIIKHIFEKYY